METPTISLPPRLELKLNLTDEQFWQLCHDNDDLRFETTATGKLIVMSPTGSLTSERNADLTFQVKIWNWELRIGNWELKHCRHLAKKLTADNNWKYGILEQANFVRSLIA
ncbi:MAG: Uma2 family endonuclease [Symploca sp. SIO2D2]|nr:Uma2 family endonuclease [Symploca sp. SIO2D2]